MGERRYGVYSRRRSPSPRRPPPRSRDVNPSRDRKFSPYHRRGKEEFSRTAETSRRIEIRDRFDRDFNLRAARFSEYDSTDRDKYVGGGPRSRSPLRVEERDSFDSDIRTRNLRFSDYGDVGKGNYRSDVGVGRSGRSYDDDSYHGDLSSMKYQRDNLLDRPGTSDHLSRKDYSRTRDYNGGGYSNVTSDGGKKDYYPYSRYLDSNRAGLLSVSPYMDTNKPLLEHERGGRMHSHSYTLTHGGAVDIPMSSLNGNDGSIHMPSVASRHLNTDTDKQGYAHFRDEHHLQKTDEGLRIRDDPFFERKNDGFNFQCGFPGMEKPVGREIYNFKNEEDLLSSRRYLKGDSDYIFSSSRPNDHGSVSLDILRERFPGYSASGDLNMSSHMIRPGSGLDSQPISFAGHGEIPRGPGGQLDDTRSRSCLYIVLPDEKQGDAEFGRSKIGSMSTRLNGVEEEYKDQHTTRIDVLNPTVDESYHKRRIRDDEVYIQYTFSQAQSMPDKFAASGSRYARKQDLEMLGTGSSHLHYGTEEYCGYDSVKREEHYAEVGGGQWSHVERPDISQSRGYDPSLDGLYDSSRKRLAVAELSLVEPSERRLSHKHVRDEILYEHDAGVRISADGNGARMIYNELDAVDEIDPVRLSRKPYLSESNYEKTGRASHEMANDLPSSSRYDRSRVKSRIPDSRDIKKRLGPVPRKLHVSQRLAKRYNPFINKRLAPALPKKRANLPWLRNQSSKCTEGVQHDSGGSPHNHDGDHLGEDHLPLPKPEPHEKSEDFKQLVQSAFLKFLKQINETPTKRKKYKEHGKAVSVTCIVCGSNSDEFVETESLAMHAFTSKKVGLRSQHLGLHKALCVLMGWKITEDPSSEWHCEVMSKAEASVLKEDIIIWPPVVIVHNSTIDNKNPDELVILSTEKLETKLGDMGFQSIVKVCSGKPANQSVMLVKFNGTLSGLKEAERLHRSYFESKHGRANLKQLKSGGTEVTSAEKEENFLYGHLGIAEDLDKLDFDIKKRCVLRSKKEILSIVDAP